MPVEFLTDDQVVAYGRVPAALSRGQIERWWHFDDADRGCIDRRRRAHNRVGFGVQLGTVRMIGRFQDDPLDVPTAVLDYVAEQLGEDASNVKAYGQRPKTALEHTWEIRRVFGYRDYLDAADEFTAWLDARAWTTGDGPKARRDAGKVQNRI